MMEICRWIRDMKMGSEAVFSGHFGPMRVGAIFISIFAKQFLEDHIIRPSDFDWRRSRTSNRVD